MGWGVGWWWWYLCGTKYQEYWRLEWNRYLFGFMSDDTWWGVMHDFFLYLFLFFSGWWEDRPGSCKSTATGLLGRDSRISVSEHVSMDRRHRHLILGLETGSCPG